MQCPNHSTKKLCLVSSSFLQRCQICHSPATHFCQLCNYVQCSTCLICPQRHALQKMIDLKVVKPQYSNGSYGCDICKKIGTLDDDGIWHCNQCNWGCCPECFE